MNNILHCDLNNFFASALVLKYPQYKDCAVAVGGKEEDRHGVIVSANYKAKQYGIKCGVSTYTAKKLCKDVVILESDFEWFSYLSNKVKSIYENFTDKVEQFSIDECFLDVTGSHKLFGTSEEIAFKIKERVKNEIGLTISVGVSFNKCFAKIGSDLKKPDAITVISQQNYKQVVWNLPINAMLGIGHQTEEKLKLLNILTIKDLALTNQDFLVKRFGKQGKLLWEYANGLDNSVVKPQDKNEKPKSVGNSTTFYKDLSNSKEIKLGITTICENLVTRLFYLQIFYAKTLQLIVKDSKMNVYQKQCQLEGKISSSNLIENAYKLFVDNYSHLKDIRLLGVTVSNFKEEDTKQISIFDTTTQTNKKVDIDKAIIGINNKYNENIVTRANSLYDKKISNAFNGRRKK